MSEILLHERRDEIAILTLNRPEQLNALNYALIDALCRALDALEAEDSVRGLIITGAADRAFSAGADIREFRHSIRAGTATALREFCRRGQNLTRRLENCPKPIVAAVNGLAYGGGCEISEAMSFTVAAEDALFCKAEIRLGLIPDFGGTQRLPRLVGRKHALDMVLTGDPIPAERAARIGLVNRVVPKADVLGEAIGWLRRVTRNSPLAVEAAMAAINRGVNVSIDEGLAIESAHFARLVPTADLAEGIDAFLHKREPHFVGR